MKNKTDMPESAWARGLEGGRTAFRMGGLHLKNAAKRAFLSGGERLEASRESIEKSAEALFEGLCRLKGTALKAAQLLSLEMDLLPSEYRAQLEKSFHSVPPMNRAMARKVIVNEFDRPPEEVFRSFDSEAFAAASLGQVHRAEAPDGSPLAVKIQYPGISGTIRSDILMLKALFRPFSEYHLIRPVLVEIEARLMEETDYLGEAKNALFFKENLNLTGVRIPAVHEDLCTSRVLCMAQIQGRPLDEWLKTGPSAEARDRVAKVMYDIFLKGLYELRCIHADPNPGNFIIDANERVGLVDFGCVKRFDPSFTDLYRRLPEAVMNGDKEAYFSLLDKLGGLTKRPDDPRAREIMDIADRFGKWLGRLYREEAFDFSLHPDFIRKGKEITASMMKYRDNINVNPDFVFLNRTRYGLLRIFERMGARVSFRNPYEWNGA